MPNAPGRDTKALVTGIYLNEYDRVVKPQQRFLIPNYFIEYWVNPLGPTLSWIIVSLQQACWRETSDQCTISQSVIADEIGIERRTVSRVLKESPLRHWFIPEFEYQKGIVHRASKTYQPLPYKYSVYLSIPLTPEHMAGLSEYFRQECPTANSSSLEQAIQKLLNLKSREALVLLEQYYHEATQHFENPLPLPELVEAATGLKIKALPSAKVAEIEQKLSGLHTHLTEIGHTICRQYFRLDWVPLLGPAMAWLVMALRSHCYYNPDRGELRDICTWRKKELAAMIGQSRYNLRLLLTHPYAEHFFQILDNQKHQLTVKVSMIQESLVWETPAEFWSTQPRSLSEMPSHLKNVENCDITLDQNVEKSDMTTIQDVEFYDMNSVRNVEKDDNTLLETLKNVTSPPENVEICDSLKYYQESVLDVVENKETSENKNTSTELQDLLSRAGLSGTGLGRLCHKEPPLDPRKVRAVILYAKANHLGPGYIYTHLATNAVIDELYLRFGQLDEPILELFQQVVEEMKINGDGHVPDLSRSLPPERVDLFAQFAEIFAGVEAATVAAAVHYQQSTMALVDVRPPGKLLDCRSEPPGDGITSTSQISLTNRDQVGHPQVQTDMGVTGGASKHLSQNSLQVTGERVGTDQRDTEALWNQVLGQLQLQMARGTFDTWLKDTRLIARKGSKFIIAVGNGYAKEWLENRLLTTIQRTLIGFIKTDGGQKLTELEIEFVVKGC